jgi:hypothetical protein
MKQTERKIESKKQNTTENKIKEIFGDSPSFSYRQRNDKKRRAEQTGCSIKKIS